MPTITEVQNALRELQGTYRAVKPIVLESRERHPDMDACYIVTSHRYLDSGYPQITMNGTFVLVSHLVLSLYGKALVDSAGNKQTCSHLCELKDDSWSRACVNPNHLVVESLGDNIRRKY